MNPTNYHTNTNNNNNNNNNQNSQNNEQSINNNHKNQILNHPLYPTLRNLFLQLEKSQRFEFQNSHEYKEDLKQFLQNQKVDAIKDLRLVRYRFDFRNDETDRFVSILFYSISFFSFFILITRSESMLIRA